MKAFRQLGFLKLTAQRDQAAPDDHRVLALFRNRAELKKAFGELKEEVERLKDRIKQQEGVTRRVRETLGSLETRLGLSETAFPALVFYQLRRLWNFGYELLERFCAELAGQQEQRERREHLAAHNRRQFALQQTAQERMLAAQGAAAREHERLDELVRAREQLRRFWHFFKRRSAERAIAQAHTVVAAADEAVTAARQTVADIAEQQPPEYPGLSLKARRAINIAVIAYAEVMCIRIAPMQLLVMRAREAMRHREVIDDYGSRAECQALMNQIERAEALLSSHARLSREIRSRSVSLRPLASYRDPQDTIPMAESLSVQSDAIPAIPNVLAEDTWNIHGVMLR